MVLIDQLVKNWVVYHLAIGQILPLIGGVISITRLNNTGAAWSILSGHQFIFVIIGLIAVIVLIGFIIRLWRNIWYRISLSFLIAGTLGNIIDRIFSNHVIDMFQLDFINFPIFNCADVYLTIGVLLLAYIIIKEK